MKRIGLAALFAFALLAPAVCSAAAYNIVTSAPFQRPCQGCGVNVLKVTPASTADTLLFGGTMDWANVYIKSGECVKLKWITMASAKSDSLYQQRGGSTPPVASRAKSRYRALRFESDLIRFCGLSGPGSNIPASWSNLLGVIYQGTGVADTLLIQAGTYQ